MAITTPKISFPFHLRANGQSAVVVEQDSDDEIVDCVETLLSTEEGSREELPAYGIDEQVFLQGGVDLDVVMATVARWEPRALVVLEADEIEALVQRVRVKVMARDG